MPSPTSVGLLVACTAVLTVLLAPLAYRMLHACQILDVPNYRSSHDRPTVRGGGVACAAALALVWAGAGLAGVDMPSLSLLAALGLAGVGLADDIWGLPAPGRLLAQVAAGVALGAALGGAGSSLLGALAFPVAVNAVNFMDGINGITGLTVGAWAVVVLAAGSGSTGSAAAILAALALGQALGFLPWNLPQARMFLGDSGSYLFGGLIAAAVVQAYDAGGSYWLVIAPLAIYLFDTGYTLLGRFRRRAPVLRPHREHFYQRLAMRDGWSHHSVALLMGALAMVVGFSWVWLPGAAASAASAVGLVLYVWLVDGRRSDLIARKMMS